ncbi:MAG: hypothetical protein ACRCYO_18375, partial [Bacteroidia bacterium]
MGLALPDSGLAGDLDLFPGVGFAAGFATGLLAFLATTLADEDLTVFLTGFGVALVVLLPAFVIFLLAIIEIRSIGE